MIAAAVGRAAERVHRLPLFFDRIETGGMLLAEMAELLPERALLAVVEGPGGRLGVVAICPGLLTSLIEMQAVGRVSSRPAGERRPTRTDGLICVDFVNACLAELGQDLARIDGFGGVVDYHYASHVDDPRPLALLLEDQPFLRIAVELRAGNAGQRDGRLVIALPQEPPTGGRRLPEGDTPAATGAGASHTPSGADQRQGTEGDSPPAAARQLLGELIRDAPLTLQAVLARRMISLRELRSLAPGDLLSLPRGVLDMATLETPDGQLILRGRLGQLGGCHALRILPPKRGSGTGETTDAGLAATALDECTGEQAAREFDRVAAWPPGDPPMDDLAVPDPFRQAETGAESLRADEAMRARAQGDAALDGAAWPAAMAGRR